MISIRALRTEQAKGIHVFSFFLPGQEIMNIADISRIHRSENNSLHGFQRKEIKQHINNIVDYLEQTDALFPNSILLALSQEVIFKQARGKAPDGITDISLIGTLSIPIREEGQRPAWIVDGQQRSIALSKANCQNIPVPVVAFVAPDIETQRKQFILVNKAKPLPTRLINELLPEVDTYLPRDLSSRKIPSILCNLLNQDPNSPFYQLIKQVSQTGKEGAVVTDSSIIGMIKSSLSSPLGALGQYKGIGTTPSDTDGMYQTLLVFWNAVKDTFPNAWGKPPTHSRLMHSAGIQAMGTLMDKIITRSSTTSSPEKHIRDSLNRISSRCCWTTGVWEKINIPWNEVQQTNKHIRQLSDLLCHLDYTNSIQQKSMNL